MRKFYITLVISFLVQITIFSQTAPISFSLPTTKFCPGQIFPISFTNDPLLNGHTFQVQLSNSSGSFASGVSVLGSGISSPVSCTMISSSTNSTSLYKVRIIDFTSPTHLSLVSDVITINSLFSSLSRYPLDSLGNSTSTSTICTGSSLKLFAITSLHDNYSTTYEWKNTSNPLLIISTSHSYTVTQSDSYNVKVSKPGCTSQTTSSSAISFSSAIYPSIIFPGNLNCIGSTKSLIATHYSDFATYEWKKDGVVIVGETGKVLNVNSSGYYNVKVTDKTCQGIGGTGNIFFGNNIDVQIDSNTDTVKICTGSSHTFVARYAFSNGNTIEWFRNGLSIAPAAPHTLSNRFQNANIEGAYTFKITEGICSVMSSPVILNNISSFSPKIIKDSENTTCVNPTVLKVIFPNIFNGAVYQWKNSGTIISGATSTSYTTGTTSGSYTFRVTQGTCTGESEPINISVINDNPPYTIISAPIVCSTGYRLSMSPLYPYPYYNSTSYQWFKDNVVISGATSDSYNALISGIYKLRITKNTCVGFSQDLNIVIGSTLAKPILTITNTSFSGKTQYQCLGNVAIIGLSINPSLILWKKDGVIISNPNGSTNYFNTTQSGNYSIRYTFGSCSIESDPIKINIGDKQQSIKTNNWNDPSSWACGTVPIVTDEVIINKGHTISLPDNYTGFLKNLELNGVLQKGNNAQLKFQIN